MTESKDDPEWREAATVRGYGLGPATPPFSMIVFRRTDGGFATLELGGAATVIERAARRLGIEPLP